MGDRSYKNNVTCSFTLTNTLIWLTLLLIKTDEFLLLSHLEDLIIAV